MKIGKYIWLGLLSGCLWGCSSDADLGEEPVVEEFAEIPITFNFLTKGSLTTRVSEDPNDGIPASEAREVYVDRVLLKVYKRPIGTYSDNIEDFMLDERNDNKVLVCEEQTQFPYYIAHGRIDLSSSYEYRVSAIAYSEELEERNLFDFEGRRLENTRLMLIDEQRKTPEIFFGLPVANGQDSVFRYAGSSGQELEGWLYRGIAGIELKLTNVDEGISKIELLADQLNTSVYTRYYDDFLSPLDLKQDDGSYTHFVLGSADAILGEDDGKYQFEKNTVLIKGMNLLQSCTSLRLRITRVNNLNRVIG